MFAVAAGEAGAALGQPRVHRAFTVWSGSGGAELERRATWATCSRLTARAWGTAVPRGGLERLQGVVER